MGPKASFVTLGYTWSMKVFVATSYSSKVDYATGEVFADYRRWLEDLLKQLEDYGHQVFCALREDNWRINDLNPGQAFQLDEQQILECDGMLAIVTDIPSAGVQLEMGMVLAKKKKLVIAHEKTHQLAYFNQAVVSLGQAKEVLLPLTKDPFVK